MVNFEYREKYDVDDFIRIMEILRSPEGCPWDREQDHQSIRRNMLEEAYEVCEAIDQNDTENLREELGDVLMQVLFHSQMEKEAGRFDINDVADGACKKLIRRHPHIFGDTRVSGSAEVLNNWDDIKRQEKEQKTAGAAMDSVARSLPALWRAEKIQEKAKKSGFDWPDVAGALDKLQEEITELREAVQSGIGIGEELGDVLFAAVNVSRFVGVDPEDALHFSCDKFIRRFEYIEKEAGREGRKLEDMGLHELEEIYQRGKKKLKNESL